MVKWTSIGQLLVKSWINLELGTKVDQNLFQVKGLIIVRSCKAHSPFMAHGHGMDHSMQEQTIDRPWPDFGQPLHQIRNYKWGRGHEWAMDGLITLLSAE